MANKSKYPLEFWQAKLDGTRTARSVADELGCDVLLVYRAAKRHDLPLASDIEGPNSKFSLELVDETKSAAEIARALGCTRSWALELKKRKLQWLQDTASSEVQ